MSDLRADLWPIFSGGQYNWPTLTEWEQWTPVEQRAVAWKFYALASTRRWPGAPLGSRTMAMDRAQSILFEYGVIMQDVL